MPVTTSIVIPAFNEADRLASGFQRLQPVLHALDVDNLEVIVIDDGSSDATLRVAHDVYGHLVHSLFIQQPVNRGKGAAVRLGFALARGQRIIVADADMAIHPRHFPDIVAALAHCPIVPGSRALERPIRYDSPLRTVAGGTFNALVRHYAGTNVRDTQCGCKGFRSGPARLLGLLGMVNGFAFDVELFFLAAQLGLAVEPLAVTWDDVSGSSVKIGRDSWSMLRDLRALPHTEYINPVIELDRDVESSAINPVAQSARVAGLVLARGPHNALLVLARDAALAGRTLATALGGTLRTAGLGELRARTYEAV